MHGNKVKPGNRLHHQQARLRLIHLPSTHQLNLLLFGRTGAVLTPSLRLSEQAAL